jgi:hypothetical protein
MGVLMFVRNVVEFQVEKLSSTQMDMTKVTVRRPTLRLSITPVDSSRARHSLIVIRFQPLFGKNRR